MSFALSLPLSFILAACAAAAYADTSSILQTQLEFLDASASTGGATARRSEIPASDKEAVFKNLDIDGDGSVSRSEAAGNEPVTVGFDRADRNRDGKLSWKEYDQIGKPPAKKKARQARNKTDSASAGGTNATEKAKP